MIAKFFIERPVLANVIALLIVILGIVALYNLPVAQYPDVVPPTVQVTARYPGASASTVAREVALPIEQRVNGVEGMIYMSSLSTSDGQYTLTVSFKIGTDGDKAQILVQNRVSSALASLPDSVQKQGVQTNKRSTSILEIVALSSPDGRYDSLFLSNYATINLLDEIARLDGVGNVAVFGAGQYAIRIWLDPQKLQARGLVPQDVINAVNLQSRSTSAGQVGLPPVPQGQAFQYSINVHGKLDDVSEFENIIVKTDQGGRITRLKDVATVELGAQQYSQTFKLDQQPAAGMAIYQLPNANALEVAKLVEGRMQELAKSFPEGMTWTIPFDTTKFVNSAVHEVYKTLIEAAMLVLVVILVFLQDWRATLVPATTVPVTIIGAFAAMAALGFTVNLSTLFAIILAIGIVVDDAIIVVEGAAKHIEHGMTPHDAAVKAMDELLGPILGITLVLMAVFIPAAFLPGLSGQMYRQFALVIAATALISAINAMTLKPTQCALWLRHATPPEKRNVLSRGFNYVYNALERAYAGLIARMVGRSGIMALIVAALVGLAVWGLSRVPTGFLPIEDQGYFLVVVQLPEGAALERTTRALDDITTRVKAQPGVEKVVAIAGIAALNDSASLSNAGVAYVILKDWEERGEGEDLLGLYLGLSARVKDINDGTALVIPPPAIQGIGNVAGATMKVEIRDGSFDYAKLQRLAQAVADRAGDQSMIQSATNVFLADAPQINVDIDRIKAETLGVPLGNALDALSSYIGSSYVGQFNKFGRVFQIYVQADAAARINPESLQYLQVRNNDGNMVPLGTLASISTVAGPSVISLYNLYPAATVITATAQGFSSGQGINLLEQIANDTLPRGTGYEWTAMSYQEKEVGNQIYLIYGLSLLLVYLVLAGQYESWIAPATVIISVPLALLGTAAALLALRVGNNLYTQIGLILLIALSSKNAILIVEFARELRIREGKDILEAAVEAARSRFRPILMTSFAFILGVVPLVLASGAGANAQKSIGIAVFTGMLGSTLLTVVFVPSVFVVMQRLEEWRDRRKAQRGNAAAPAATP
ncbi:MAG: efflux RND transporter permease subunit [Hyphomicrobium sp.]|uniref:efflux RND transporter permease subunit n=1 Tax=Hyphomicrobium sp. TaxID=82 RepID=UPI00132B65AE|nr:efflux RND transporter permease subunit [Hyphomicrobium sp.]KAB2939276.1 MAG: efflux RND transporter permease subunit [Hyphomicrobium sp.]MBZ0208158.1 efflux RND transporter permease subunit [Hyphomicrobium sp.]